MRATPGTRWGTCSSSCGTASPTCIATHVVHHLQDIQEALVSSGVHQRLQLPGDAAAAPAAAAAALLKRSGDMRNSTSPRSTITLKTCLEADQVLGTPSNAMAPGAIQMRRSNRSEGDTEVGAAQQRCFAAAIHDRAEMKWQVR
jgi:hypothetical protein